MSDGLQTSVSPRQPSGDHMLHEEALRRIVRALARSAAARDYRQRVGEVMPNDQD